MTSSSIAVSVIDYNGVEVVLYDRTLAAHIWLNHPSSNTQTFVSNCLAAPYVVVTNPQDHEHPDRQNYYRLAKSGPRYLRVIVEHQATPSAVVTFWRTDEVGPYGDIVYTTDGFIP